MRDYIKNALRKAARERTLTVKDAFFWLSGYAGGITLDEAAKIIQELYAEEDSPLAT